MTQPTRWAGTMGDCKCECCDKGCAAHIGNNECCTTATTILYRVDMEDMNGTAMCDDCANDATMSGLFIENDDPQFDEYCEEDSNVHKS